MISEIKRIKLEELDKQKHKLIEQEANIKSGLEELQLKLEQLRNEEKNITI